MPTWMPEILREHWRVLLIAYVAMNFVQTMPSPGQNGFTSSWGYKWIFGALHTMGAAVPRIIYTIFPQYVKFLPWNGMTQPGGNAAQPPSAPADPGAPSNPKA